MHIPNVVSVYIYTMCNDLREHVFTNYKLPFHDGADETADESIVLPPWHPLLAHTVGPHLGMCGWTSIL